MRKHITELKSWADLAEYAPMVLFNKWNTVNEGAIFYEWQEQHYETCPAEQARVKIEELEESTKPEDIKKRQELIDEWGEDPECNCEMYQTYIIDLSEWDIEYLKKEFDLDIFWSDTIDNYILQVYHFGTSWRIMGLAGGYVNL